MRDFLVGQGVRLWGYFSDPTRGVLPLDTVSRHSLVDPDGEVTVTLRSPDGSTEERAALRDSQGVYYADVQLDLPGAWTYRFTATGAAAPIGEGTLWAS